MTLDNGPFLAALISAIQPQSPKPACPLPTPLPPVGIRPLCGRSNERNDFLKAELATEQLMASTFGDH